jgi:S-DNA-T family DNA segregation ATPase FtsK/SpoIIIE
MSRRDPVRPAGPSATTLPQAAPVNEWPNHQSDSKEPRVSEQVSPDVVPDVASGEVVGPVYTAELVSDEENAELDTQLAERGQRLVRVSRVVTVVRESDRARAAARVGARTVVEVYQGLESWARRVFDASTMGVYRRQIRAAEAMGNQEQLLEWTERKERVRAARHDRLLRLPGLLAGIVRTVAGMGAMVVGLVVLTGLFVQVSGAGEFMNFLAAVLGVIRWVLTAFAVCWTPVVLSLPFWVLLAARREGRRRGDAPGWLVTTSEADMDVAIDETTIARALEALRIPQITGYLKKGMPLQFLTPARVDGRGTHAVLRLPDGVTAEKIARRRADLATGLHRLAKEVWPCTGAEAGILDLWVADKGALAEGAGVYPLLESGTVDVFKGVPIGKTLRGVPIRCLLMGCNTLVGGIPGQGKSTAAMDIAAGASLDPTVELRIWVPDTNYDFEAFRRRCSRYVMGAEDEHIEQILHDLRELHAEVQARGELLVRFETPAVSRELANKNVGLHPLICLLEEAHVAIQHRTYGADISKLLIDIVRLGRKRGIHLILSTQAPTKDSMPRDVTRNCSNGIAFAVGDHVANDALLGQGAYAGGHRATELLPTVDRGTAVVKGITGERSEIVQFYFLDPAKEHDQITPIIERSLAAIAERGHVRGAGAPTPRVEVGRDLLADLDEVLGDEPVRAADLPALLAAHVPGWVAYRELTGKALCVLLAAEYGIKVPSTHNKWPVDPVTVRNALAERATTEHDEDDG